MFFWFEDLQPNFNPLAIEPERLPSEAKHAVGWNIAVVSAARVVSPLIPLIPAEAIGRPWAVAASQPSGLTQLIAGCQVKKKKPPV